MGNETIKLQDVMGSPMEMLKPMLSEVRWLFGTSVWLGVFIDTDMYRHSDNQISVWNSDI